jgi:hypothetical protein
MGWAVTGPLLSTRDRRALLLGGSALALATVGLRGLPALLGWTTSERVQLQRIEFAIEDARREAAALPWMRDSAIVRRMRARALDPLFLRGASPSLAAAYLANELSDDAKASDLQMAALQADPSDSTQSIQYVRARASVSGDLKAVMRFIARVEAGPPMLAVREVSLSARDGQASAQHPEVIHADIVIEGIAKRLSSTQAPR